jgi:V8-like Glu-specific endopeptidase
MAVNPSDYLSAFKGSIIRIFHANGAIVGAGFLVSPQYVLTCAHVVAAALGIPNNTKEAPTDSIHLDFPLVAAGQKIKAQVVFWQPMNPSVVGEDIAGLKLEGELPNDVQPVRLVTADELWAHPIRIFGFPGGHTNGVWASGVLRDKLANGWVQIEDDKVTGLRVEQGFSGAPVWDETLAGVVGMTVAAERQRQEGKVAFIIPTKVLSQAWSILGQIEPVASEKNIKEMSLPNTTSSKTRSEFYKKRLAVKQEELAAIESHLEGVLANVDELKLNKQAERLMREIEELEMKLNQL